MDTISTERNVTRHRGNVLLLERLERTFGVQGRVLAWFRSYLTERTYWVIYAGVSSSVEQVTCSVPQGSVLGPLLFLLYTADLADLAAKHGVTLYAFADDTQLYIHCDFHNMATSRDVLERCIQDIGHWILANRLKLNPDKTELLWTGTRHSLSRLADGGPRLVLGTEVIDASSFACLLGETFTSDLCLEKHASFVSGRCFFQLRQLRRVRRLLESEAASTLIHSFVSSRVDYCNSNGGST